MTFQPHSECKNCSLCESASHPGIPTRPYQGNYYTGSKTALLIVGQAPGYNEDRKGECFIGYTGGLLDKFINAAGFRDLCDIFLGNAMRCLPPQGANETQSQMRACRPYLQDDIDVIRGMGYERVIILALGAKAAYSTMNKSSLSEAFKHQGIESPVFEGCRVFCTYHPAMLHSRRSPGKIKAVEAHFMLLRRYLTEGLVPNALNIQVELGIDIPNKLPSIVVPDIETYGILEGVNQTAFHPIKSKVIDGIPFHEQVAMISFAWEEGSGIRTAEYVWKNRQHRHIVHEWFHRMSKEGIICLGQNIKFDLLYLAMCGDPVLQYWIDPARLKVDDTLLWAFLYYEQQPEKGLKEQALLHGVVDYGKMKVTGKTGNAKGPNDPDAHLYNCCDTATTMILRRVYEGLIRDRYGKNSPKLGKVCEQMRNTVIWDVFDLEKNGSAFDLRRVEAIHRHEEARCLGIAKMAEEKYGLKFFGPGSDKPLRELMLEGITEAGLLNDSRIEWTKNGTPSIGVENVNLVVPELKRGRTKRLLAGYQKYKERSKLVSTYTRPLVQSPIKGIVTRSGNIGMCYPSWYPIPAYSNRGGSAEDKSGGQIQGRFSCQKPARQTEPQRIRKCSRSRWEGGSIIECDMSQDHLRMAALMSGDPTMLGIYERGESIHMKTAAGIFPEYDLDGFKKKYPQEYTLCKSLNFAVIFRCGAGTFQQTALHDVGIDLDIGFCAKSIHAWSQTYPVYWAWQDRMIALAAKQGYIEMPTGWSRTFGVGKEAAEAQMGEVLNVLHQCNCAQLTHSAHYQIQQELRKEHLRSVICLNIYDALFLDRYPGEEEEATEILFRNMNNPPLLPLLENYYGHHVKWEAELKEYK